MTKMMSDEKNDDNRTKLEWTFQSFLSKQLDAGQHNEWIQSNPKMLGNRNIFNKHEQNGSLSVGTSLQRPRCYGLLDCTKNL